MLKQKACGVCIFNSYGAWYWIVSADTRTFPSWSHNSNAHSRCKGWWYLCYQCVAHVHIYIFSFFWISGGIVMSQQKGVFRVNCIDCLDRTNVVQVSAFVTRLNYMSNAWSCTQVSFCTLCPAQSAGGCCFTRCIRRRGSDRCGCCFQWWSVSSPRSWDMFDCFIVWANNGDAISRA